MPAYGRGGAGNIEAGTQKPAPEKDLEKQSNASAAVIRDIDPADPPGGAREYAHGGRGGAGNWYQPKDLAKGGSYDVTTDASPAAPSTQTSSRAPRRASEASDGMFQYKGRGGAGNFVGGSTQLPEKVAIEQELNEKAKGDVEMKLPKPQQAWLGGRERAAPGNVEIQLVDEEKNGSAIV